MENATNTAVKQSEFARIIGVDRSYITRLKKEGRIVFDEFGLVLVEASKKRIKETSDPNRDDVSNRWRSQRVQNSAEIDEQDEDDTKVEDHDYQRARAKKEHFLAERARVDYLRDIGELVPISDMRAAVADVVTAFRQTLEQLPHRTGPDLIGKDLDGIRATLKQDIRAALSDMEREFTKRLANAESGA